MQRKPDGFTLVELSIVMVIIGLIIGGVVMGRDLIAVSQLRAQVAQFEKYNAAVNTFRGKYGCLPGDCANATTFFTALTPGYYADGDGDGLLTDTGNTTGFPINVDMEPTAFWVHLYEAGLTECCSSSNLAPNIWGTYVIGQAFPRDKMNGRGITTGALNGKNGFFWGITNDCVNWSCGSGINPNSLPGLSNAVKGLISPAQAQAFDAKIDDGHATTGKVYAAWLYGGDAHVHPEWYHAGYYCLTNATPNEYDVSFKDSACTPWINMN